MESFYSKSYIFLLPHTNNISGVYPLVVSRILHKFRSFMKMKLYQSISVISIILSAIMTSNTHATGAGDNTKAVNAIAAVNQQLEIALSTADPAKATSIYTRDGQLLPPNSKIISGTDNIYAYWQAAFTAGVKGAELETIELDIQGDTAIEIGRYVIHGEEKKLIDEGKYLIYWKKEGKNWKYHRDMWSSVLAPQ